MSPDSIVLALLHAEGNEDISESFNQIEREMDLQHALEQERAEHERTRAALQEQTRA
jgi:hypothetical protein